VYLAKSFVSIIVTAVSSGVFLAWWGWLAQPPAAAGLYFLLIWLVYFAVHGLGFLVSIALSLEMAGMIGILIVFILTLFSVTLNSFSGGQVGFQTIASYFSFISWSSQVFYVTSVAPFNATLTPWMQNAYAVNPNILNFAWVQVLIYGLWFRLVAWLALVYKEE
jgi:hypothetical protein